MAGLTGGWTQAEIEEIHQQLGRILTSPVFAHSPRQSRFLSYIVRETLAGGAKRLNQRVIGLEVFDRGESFDPAVDSIVRVEAGRMRGKLREYYHEFGKADVVYIELPKHGYAGGRATVEVTSATEIRVCYLDNREGAQGAGCALLKKA